jgi:hypothetical protein
VFLPCLFEQDKSHNSKTNQWVERTRFHKKRGTSLDGKSTATSKSVKTSSLALPTCQQHFFSLLMSDFYHDAAEAKRGDTREESHVNSTGCSSFFTTIFESKSIRMLLVRFNNGSEIIMTLLVTFHGWAM